MTDSDIARQRLFNQGIKQAAFKKPENVVSWLGAVQAQDYTGAKWALGLRIQGSTDADIESAFTNGSILRTHALRPTWHFVTSTDIRWILALTAPRVHAVNALMYRKQELDQATFKRSHQSLTKALRDGKQLSRDELRVAFQRAGIAADSNLRMSYLMMNAELEGIICSGARRGKQFTYSLLDERAPNAKRLERDEALAEFAKRFFTSHGPATVRDFAWWSGLTTTEAAKGLEEIKSELECQVVDNKMLWSSPSKAAAKDSSPLVYLLPNYDEYTIGYREHSAIYAASNDTRVIFSNIIILNGQIVGTWKRTLEKSRVIVTTNRFQPLTKVEKRAVAAAADQYGAFLGLTPVLA